ncbi:hypothetical protein LSH36_1234g00033 [Paralvinella palmiformis]|uniref:Uncharacterized protein n=1 Tax=Paralvinella palmiformis TaxID=53620 RepID=A0AAD9IUJ8_9ANNE|nr:hypothetical protein LSH36_1234g00033 [Paralvinella palmiformis]
MAARQSKKQEHHETTERSKLQKKLDPGGLTAQFPELDGGKLAILQKLLEGTVVVLPICHVWMVNGSLQTYNVKIEKLEPKAAQNEPVPLGAMLTKGAVRDNLPPVARALALHEFKMASHVKTRSNTSCYK